MWKSSTKFQIGQIVHFWPPGDDSDDDCLRCLVIDEEGHHIELNPDYTDEDGEWEATNDRITDYPETNWHAAENCWR